MVGYQSSELSLPHVTMSVHKPRRHDCIGAVYDCSHAIIGKVGPDSLDHRSIDEDITISLDANISVHRDDSSIANQVFSQHVVGVLEVR